MLSQRPDPVLRAAYDSIMDVGMRRTTLADVARRAGVSRMTVYRRYDDLPGLLSALLTVELRELMAQAAAATAGLPTARERAASAIARSVAELCGYPLFTRVLTLDPETLLPLIVDRVGSTQREAHERLVEFIKAGQRSAGGDGSIREADPAAMALTVLIAAQSFVFSSRVLRELDPPGDTNRELRTMVDHYLAELPK